MSRHRKPKGEKPADPMLDISSLIDVCFLLLIYFLVSSTILPPESDLGMKSPAQDATQPVRPNEILPLSLRIEADGRVLSGEEPARQVLDTDISSRDLPLLRSQLDIYSAASRAAGIVPLVRIDADDEATQQRVIDVLNALNAAGIQSVTFTDPGKQ